jgi:hypothetical protein
MNAFWSFAVLVAVIGAFMMAWGFVVNVIFG